ncbi:MAG: hypothetical protein WCT77_03435 [Bacteroidota bacterium]
MFWSIFFLLSVIALVVLPLVIFFYLFIYKPRHLRWGVSKEEIESELPGDSIIPESRICSTRGITIKAKPYEIWQWIVQMGQSRAGFYSHDFFANMVGSKIKSLNEIKQEFQNLNVGDIILGHPEMGWIVEAIIKNEYLVLRAADLKKKGSAYIDEPPHFDFIWIFALKKINEESTRLIVREKYNYKNFGLVSILVELTAFISFIMTKKMMKGIKKRAEKNNSI